MKLDFDGVWYCVTRKTPDWEYQDSSNPGPAFSYLHNLDEIKELY